MLKFNMFFTSLLIPPLQLIFLLLASSRHRMVNKTKIASTYLEYFGSQPVLMEGEEFEDTQVIFSSNVCKLYKKKGCKYV